MTSLASDLLRGIDSRKLWRLLRIVRHVRRTTMADIPNNDDSDGRSQHTKQGLLLRTGIRCWTDGPLSTMAPATDYGTLVHRRMEESYMADESRLLVNYVEGQVRIRRFPTEALTLKCTIGWIQSSESTKVSFRALRKRSKPQVQLLERLVVTARGRQLQRKTDISSCRRKEADGRGLFARRPERCLPLKVDHRRHRLQWRREHKNWTTVNGVVSSLRMRVGSVPEAILNTF
ncbi:hypothetical protein TNCV_2846661 [Trichonephila clavipes]|nr:hypothetical protein TNCV_2846661 [Trichonephila clavipes]